LAAPIESNETIAFAQEHRIVKRKRVLIANRGEIAVRIIKACEESDLETILVVSEADQDSLPARLADKVVCIGPPQVTQSYLNIPMIMATAKATGADAIHPGYGFLAENPALPKACEENGIVFIGPRSETMRALGGKISARKLAKDCGVPINEGSEALGDVAEVEARAEEIGYPVLIKASAGGGGRGMRVVSEPKGLLSVRRSRSRQFMAGSRRVGWLPRVSVQ
jgi:acetyl-CoA carboxylase biotin carboxylase subunit